MSLSKKDIKKAFLRYLKGYYTRDDANLIIRDLPSEIPSRLITDEMDKIWEDSINIETSPARHAEYEKEAIQLLKHINKSSTKIGLKPFFRYAAAVAILILAGAAFYLFTTNQSDQNQDILMVLDVENGKREDITLSDGTKIVLNAGTSLSYPEKFGENERKIYLNGEAFLDVAVDKNKPFIVQTERAQIEVLGTSFCVNAYDDSDHMSVTVETGKVQVNMSNATMRLLPNEHLYYNKVTEDFSKTRENLKNTKLWMSGGMYFNRTPIQEVAEELMRRFDCNIEFAEGEIFEEYIYGTHDGEDLETILNAIEFTTGIKHIKTDDNIILFKKNEKHIKLKK